MILFLLGIVFALALIWFGVGCFFYVLSGGSASPRETISHFVVPVVVMVAIVVWFLH